MSEILEIEKNDEVRTLIKNVDHATAWTRDLVIKNADDEQKAISGLTLIKSEYAAGEKLRKFFVDPLKAQIDRINGLFKPKLDILVEAERIVKTRMIQYQNEIDVKAEAEKKKVLAKVEAGTMKIETAVKKIEKVPEAQKTVRTEEATVSYREVKKVIITDSGKLPREYLVPDEVKIRKVVLAGVEVPGTKIVVEKVPSIKSNF